MNKTISIIVDFLLFVIFSLAIDTLAFSSMMYIIEFYGEGIGVVIMINVLCLSVAACLIQVWLVFYFLMDINITKYIWRTNENKRIY